MLTKFLLFTALCLAAASTSHAQSPASSPSPSGPTVGLSLIITDKNNKGVNTIHKDQIRVRENGVEQTVLSVEADERPVDYILAIDATGSFQRLLVSALEAATVMVKNRRPEDQVALMRFTGRENIEKLHEFTTDGDALIKSLNSIGWEGGRSAILDALYLGAQYVSEHNKSNEGRRKVVIIMTDGEDRSSYYNEKDLIKLLGEEGVQVFVLGFVMLLDKEAGFTRPSPRLKAEKLLTNIAEESGGRVFFPENKEELFKSAAEIILDLRAQFRIKYQSTNDAAKKGFRKVDVKFVPKDGEKRNLIVPAGYYVGPKDPPAKKQEKKS
jgi:Ca-activated chloride channel homolog